VNNRDPKRFFVAFIGAIQSRMVECVIFGEIFENGEGALNCYFTSPYLFSTSQNDLEEIRHQY